MDNSIHFSPLIKHKYPLWICISSLIVLLSFMAVVYRFYSHDFKYYNDVRAVLLKAEKYFQNNDYENAIIVYKSILGKYSTYKKAKIRIAECCFVLSENDRHLISYGLNLLKDVKFENSEINEMALYLPEELREDFVLLFKNG